MFSLKIMIMSIVCFIILALATLSFMTRQNTLKQTNERHLSPCPNKPNCVSSLATNPSQKIDHLSLINSDIDKSWQHLVHAVIQQGGEILVNDGTYLHAVFTSTFFRFKDDVEAIVTDKKHIDIRSASRAGKSDLGQNKKRVEAIRQLYTNNPK